MRRSAVFFALVLSALSPERALAESMDPVLSRLRIASGNPGCAGDSEVRFCKDDELFERLVSELGVALAPPMVSPAASHGPSGLALAIDVTVTNVDANAAQWGRTQAGVTGTPDPVLAWTHATVRKGLPFGLEVGTTIGRGHATSLWSLGLSLKWAIVEGFHSGIGVLPDVALQATTTRSMGLDDLTLATHTADLLLSKPLHVGRGYRIAPFLGVQLLFIEAESGLVDLSPGPDDSGSDDEPAPEPEDVDAFGRCRPGTPDAGQSTPLSCTGDGDDFVNNVQFNPVDQTRMRLFLGGELQYGLWRFSTALGFDLLAPSLEAKRREPDVTAPTLRRQLAFSISAGAVL
jgi:hypothetical protein